MYQFLTEFSQFIRDVVKTLGEAHFISPPVTGDITACLFVLVSFIPHNSDHFQAISLPLRWGKALVSKEHLRTQSEFVSF